MGKRRRISTSDSTDSSSEEEARILRKKLRKYKRKYERQKGRSITPETPDPDDSNKENGAAGQAVNRRSRGSSLEFSEESHQLSRVFLPVVGDDGNQVTAQDECDPLALDNVGAPLEEGILKLLGGKDSVKEKLSPGVHSDLALRWTVILKNGLEDGVRSDLMNKYPPVKNCLLMAAPKLNREVKAAITESNLKRDDRLAGVQAQVGASLSALGRALNVLIEEKEGSEDLRMRLIEIMSDSARLLADVHFQESQTRRNILSLGLKKDLTNTLSDVAVDGWLFGDNLGERVKTAKAIEQSGKELKGEKLNKRKNIPYKSSLNSKGPSRYPVPASRLGGQKHSGHNKRGGSGRNFPRPDYRLLRNRDRDRPRRTSM